MLFLMLLIFLYKTLPLNNVKEAVTQTSISKASCFITHELCMHVRVKDTPLLIHERASKALENTEIIQIRGFSSFSFHSIALV